MRWILPSLLLIALSVRSEEAPSKEAIEQAILQLGDAKFEIRESAQRQLSEWGSQDPDRILGLLPESASDLEVLNRSKELREQILAFRRHRRVLEVAGEDSAFRAKALDLARSLLDDLEDEHARDEKEKHPQIPCSAPSFHKAKLVRRHLEAFTRSAGADRTRVARVIARIMDCGDPVVRAEGAQALSSLKEPVVLPDLLPLKLLEDPDEEVRVRGIHLLAVLDEKSVLPSILKLLRDPAQPQDVRLACLWAVGGLGTKREIRDLGGFLETQDPMRTAAAGSLGRILGQSWQGEPGVREAQAWWEAHRNDPAPGEP